MRQGPCAFLSVSRNFLSWIEAGCPSPDPVQCGGLTRPGPWHFWKGRLLNPSKPVGTCRSKQTRYALNSEPRTELHSHTFQHGGFEHVVLSLPNPSDCANYATTVQSELECARQVRAVAFD